MNKFIYGFLFGIVLSIVIYCLNTCNQPHNLNVKAEKVLVDSLKNKRVENAEKQVIIEKQIVSLPVKEKIKFVEKVIPQIVQVNDTVFQIDQTALDTINLMQSRIEFLKGDTANANAIIRTQEIIINKQDSAIKQKPNGLKSFLKGLGIGFGVGYVTGKVL